MKRGLGLRGNWGVWRKPTRVWGHANFTQKGPSWDLNFSLGGANHYSTMQFLS